MRNVIYVFLKRQTTTLQFSNLHQDLKELPVEYRTSVSLFMSFVHTRVNNVSEIYLQNERRYNYTTPKSFLEQISLYSKLLTEKTYDLNAMISRLNDGLVKLASCAVEVYFVIFPVFFRNFYSADIQIYTKISGTLFIFTKLPN